MSSFPIDPLVCITIILAGIVCWWGGYASAMREWRDAEREGREMWEGKQ